MGNPFSCLDYIQVVLCLLHRSNKPLLGREIFSILILVNPSRLPKVGFVRGSD